MSAEPESTPAPYRLLFLHSTLIFTTCFLLSTFLHEGSHALTARAFGLEPVLHHNYVSTGAEDASQAARRWVPAAGPLVSLMQGLALLFWSRRRTVPTLTSLGALWLSLQGFISFFGYLCMAPMFTYGDTGKVFAELGLAPWLQWALAAGGLVGLVAVVRHVAPDFERHSVARPAGDDGRHRARSANALIAYPILVGVVFTTLLSLPVPTFLSLLHPLTSPFVVFLAYGRMRRSTLEVAVTARYPSGLSPALVGILLVAILVSRLLVVGVRV